MQRRRRHRHLRRAWLRRRCSVRTFPRRPRGDRPSSSSCRWEGNNPFPSKRQFYRPWDDRRRVTAASPRPTRNEHFWKMAKTRPSACRPGKCMTYKQCYPYFKTFNLPAEQAWVMGSYDTCRFYSREGLHVRHFAGQSGTSVISKLPGFWSVLRPAGTRSGRRRRRRTRRRECGRFSRGLSRGQ